MCVCVCVCVCVFERERGRLLMCPLVVLKMNPGAPPLPGTSSAAVPPWFHGLVQEARETAGARELADTGVGSTTSCATVSLC